MDTDIRALLALAQTYFEAAYEMDADKFASIFHHSSSVTKIGEDGGVNVTPVEMWLAMVRKMDAPKKLASERHDEVLSIDVVRELALLKVRLRIPPRHVTDMLSCLRVDGAWKICSENDDHGNAVITPQRSSAAAASTGSVQGGASSRQNDLTDTHGEDLQRAAQCVEHR